MSKFMSILAMGCFVLGLSSSVAYSGVSDRSFTTLSGVVFDKKECPEGEEWNEETKACEKKQ